MRAAERFHKEEKNASNSFLGEKVLWQNKFSFFQTYDFLITYLNLMELVFQMISLYIAINFAAIWKKLFERCRSESIAVKFAKVKITNYFFIPCLFIRLKFTLEVIYLLNFQIFHIIDHIDRAKNDRMAIDNQ